MGWKYTIRGWNYLDGVIYESGSQNILVAVWMFLTLPRECTVKYFEWR